MKDTLSHRIAHLVTHADKLRSVELKTEMLDLAKLCQVVPGNAFLLSTLCGQMEEAVTAAFGTLGMVLVMTEPGRRQVYFAVLARLETDGAFAEPGLTEAGRAELLTQMVTAGNESLIRYAYGTCPPGFVRLVARFGECARKPEIYVTLFEILTANPELAKPLLAACQGRVLSDDLILLMRELPATRLGVRVAAQIGALGDYKELMRPYRVVAGAEQLTEEHMKRIANGEAPGTLLKGLYLERVFPAPVLDIPGVTHIPDGQTLFRTAREFHNCLRDYVAEALNNERQFYIWSKPAAPEVVFAIDSEAPFGWYLSESRLAENERVPRVLAEELAALLGEHGVRIDRSLERMMEPFLREEDEPDFDAWFNLDMAA
ncbi:hypothetical protein [Roseicyclus marinus]|uniref:hypothetical protein n=1 Tax=Roseicyclus marinus TaxID=2161673 RepID=UPI00240FC82B|nr:hypothetical protein [Roseicyclus marinus]MDG3039820.1 hypothetical protein [Roseicyclus marinus]